MGNYYYIANHAKGVTRFFETRQIIKFGETDYNATYDDTAVEEREITKVTVHPKFKRKSQALDC